MINYIRVQKLKKKTQKKMNDVLTRSAIKTSRTVCALKDLNVPPHEIEQDPILTCYPLASLPRDVRDSEFLDKPLMQVVTARRNMPLRGLAIRSFASDLVETTNALRFSHPASLEKLK